MDSDSKAHLRKECFQESTYFVIKGNFDAKSRLLSGRLLLLFFNKPMNKNKLMFVSGQDSVHKTNVLSQNKYSLGSILILSVRVL